MTLADEIRSINWMDIEEEKFNLKKKKIEESRYEIGLVDMLASDEITLGEFFEPYIEKKESYDEFIGAHLELRDDLRKITGFEDFRYPYITKFVIGGFGVGSGISLLAYLSAYLSFSSDAIPLSFVSLVPSLITSTMGFMVGGFIKLCAYDNFERFKSNVNLIDKTVQEVYGLESNVERYS